MTQRELEEEPNDIYELNLSILALEVKLHNEQARRDERAQRRRLDSPISR